jgi:hypothetical protein
MINEGNIENSKNNSKKELLIIDKKIKTKNKTKEESELKNNNKNNINIVENNIENVK